MIKGSDGFTLSIDTHGGGPMESESGLLKTVVAATGLPETPVHNELNTLITKNGFNPADLTLEELREVMAEYLNLVFLEMAEAEENSASA